MRGPLLSFLNACRPAALVVVVCTTLVATFLTDGSVFLYFWYWYYSPSPLLTHLGNYVLPVLLASSLYLAGCFLAEAKRIRTTYTAHDVRHPLSPTVLSLSGYILLAISWFLSCLYSLIVTVILFQPPWSEIVALLSSSSYLSEFISPSQILLSSALAACVLYCAKSNPRASAIRPLSFSFTLAALMIWITALNGNPWGGHATAAATVVFLYATQTGIQTYRRSHSQSYSPSKLAALTLILPAPFFAFLAHLDTFAVYPPELVLLLVKVIIFMIWTLWNLFALNHSAARYGCRSLAGICLVLLLFTPSSGLFLMIVCLVCFFLTLLLARFFPSPTDVAIQ